MISEGLRVDLTPRRGVLSTAMKPFCDNFAKEEMAGVGECTISLNARQRTIAFDRGSGSDRL